MCSSCQHDPLVFSSWMVREGMAAMFIGSSSYFRAMAVGGRRKLLTSWRLLLGIIDPHLAGQMVEMGQQNQQWVVQPV